MAQTFTLEITLHEYANLITLTDLITRKIVKENDGTIWFDADEVPELRHRTAAAVKTLMQEDPE